MISCRVCEYYNGIFPNPVTVKTYNCRHILVDIIVCNSVEHVFVLIFLTDTERYRQQMIDLKKALREKSTKIYEKATHLCTRRKTASTRTC